MSYKRVPCGDLHCPLCYELCYEGVCINVRAGDPRVDVFIHAVDALGELNQAKEGDEKSNRPRTMNLFAKCGVSLVVAAASGYGLVAAWAAVTATDPEPVTKIISIGGGLFAAGLYCGAQIWLEDLAASAYNTRLAAVDGQLAIGREMFGDLLFNPPE
jgi:hypothetical protein